MYDFKNKKTSYSEFECNDTVTVGTILEYLVLRAGERECKKEINGKEGGVLSLYVLNVSVQKVYGGYPEVWKNYPDTISSTKFSFSKHGHPPTVP